MLNLEYSLMNVGTVCFISYNMLFSTIEIGTEHCLLNMLAHGWSEGLLRLLKQYF